MPASERGEAPFPEVQGDQREHLRRRLAKRTLLIDVVSFVIVNLFLVIVWATNGGGPFWPGLVMAGGALFALFAICLRKSIRELAIDQDELHRIDRTSCTGGSDRAVGANSMWTGTKRPRRRALSGPAPERVKLHTAIRSC